MELEFANRSGLVEVEWLSTNITVLKIVVELFNNGFREIYYSTNAWCKVSCNVENCRDRFKPITWRVENPITIPIIDVEKGHVFPSSVSCTLDLRYVVIPPKTSVVNEFYYIVTKPFKGTIKVSETVCLEPNIKCKVLDSSIRVVIE